MSVRCPAAAANEAEHDETTPASAPGDTIPADDTVPVNEAPPPAAARPESFGSWAGTLYETAKESIVLVRAGDSEGTGFAFLSQKMVATAFHVVEGEVAPSVTLSDGTEIPARVVAWDEHWDLALLELPRPVHGPPLQVVGDGQPRVGDPVATIGNPWGAEQRKLPNSSAPVWALSHGIISAPPGDLVQTDAPVNPGNSGGPLLTAEGRVVGVLVVRVEGSDGISFAVGSKHLIELASRIDDRAEYRVNQFRLDAEVYWIPISEQSLSGVSLGLRLVHRGGFGLAARGARLWGSRVADSVLQQSSRNRWLLESEVQYYLIDSPGFSLPLGVGVAMAWDNIETRTISLENGQLSEGSAHSAASSIRALFGLGIDSQSISLHTGVYAFGGDTGARLALGFVF